MTVREQNEDIVVVSGVRTPFSRFGGALKSIPSADLGAAVIKGLLKRSGMPGNAIDEVFYGFAILQEPPGDGKGDIPDRRAVLKAGLPPSTLSMGINKACCSSLAAVQMAVRAIRLGEAQVTIAMGADNFSRSPLLLSPEARWGKRVGHLTLYDPLFELGYKEFNPVSVDTGEAAIAYGVTREEQDKWALRSQMRYAKAETEGKFKEELIPIEVPQKKGQPSIIFDKDETPKPNTTLEGLSKLPTVYGSPTVTAGNAPGLDAGAAGVLIMTGKKAKEYGLKPLAKIVSVASVSIESKLVPVVPASSIEKVLSLAGLTLDDIDLIEINEAFAAMPLVSSKVLADKYYQGNKEKLEQLREKINVNGGAIALGHPVGASGVRILMTLIYELKRRGGTYGACSICGGLGQGTGAVVKVC
ncbi:MAG: thiolase family protein [Dehalococcoidia bacterium]|jgi:acetyl-CoA C-acetyltransferase